MKAMPLLRVFGVLAFGMASVACTAYLIARLQGFLEVIGYPMPRVLFLGVLSAGVVYVAIWAMERYSRELKRYRTRGNR